MFSPDNVDILFKILANLKDVLLGAIGGLVAYLFDYTRAARTGDTKFVFRFSSMTVNALLGAFVAYSVGTFVPLDVVGRDAIIGFSGVSAYNILLLAESKVANLLFDRLLGKK